MPDNGYTDNEIYCLCQIGNLGSRIWVKGGAETAAAIFHAGRIDNKPGFRELFQSLSGTYVGGFNVIQWGKRVWQSFNSGGRGRWHLIEVLGEVNERNAGKPPIDLLFEEFDGDAPAGDPPILERKCFRYSNIFPAAAKLVSDGGRYPIITRDHQALHIEEPEGFRADKYAISYQLSIDGVRGSDGRVFSVYPYIAPVVGEYPIKEKHGFGYHRTEWVPVDEGFIYEPATAPANTIRTYLKDEFSTQERRDAEGNYETYPARREHHLTDSKFAANWIGLGNLDLKFLLARGYDFGRYVAPGTSRRLIASVQLHYTHVPYGYRIGWGGSASFDYKKCVKPPKQKREKPNVCTSGMDIEGNCIVIRTCNPDGTQAGWRTCAGSEEGVPFLKTIFEKTRDGKPAGDLTIELGGDAKITYTDDEGFEYPILFVP